MTVSKLSFGWFSYIFSTIRRITGGRSMRYCRKPRCRRHRSIAFVHQLETADRAGDATHSALRCRVEFGC